MRIIALLVVLVMLAALIPVASNANTNNSQHIDPVTPTSTINYNYTNVYNMLEYNLQQTGITPITRGILVKGTDTLLIAGNQSYAILQVNSGSRALNILSTGSLIGENKKIFVDSMAAPKWYGYAQDSGEVVLVNSSNPLYTLSYYTATRKAVINAELINTSNGTRLLAIDEEGFAYIYNVGEPYWLEFGPTPHDTALAALPYFKISNGTVVRALSSGGVYVNGDLALLELEAMNYTGIINVSLEFYNSYNRTVEPVRVGDNIFVDNNTTARAVLHIAVSDYNNLVISEYRFSGEAGQNFTGVFPLENLPPGNYTLTAIYLREYHNATTNQLLYTEYYLYQTKITVYPLLTITIGPYQMELQGTLSQNITDSLIDNIMGNLGLYLPRRYSEAVAEFLTLNLTKLNMTTIYSLPDKGHALWVTHIPLPAGAPGNIQWYEVYKPNIRPPGWPSKAEYLMLIATNNATVYIYMLDENMTPIFLDAVQDYFETIYLGATASAYPAVYPDLSRIYLGAESGYLLELRWLQDFGRYVGSHSYIIDTSSVKSFDLDTSRYLMLVSSSNGILQLLDVNTWTPLWRGTPGYYGIQTGLADLILSGKGLSYVIGISPGSTSLEVLYDVYNPLYPVFINLAITLTTLNGTVYNYTVPAGVEATIYDGSEVVAYYKTPANQSSLVFYLPTGTHTANISIPGIGSLEKNYTLTTSGAIDTIHINLRQVKLYAYTPQSVGDPKRDPGYYLLSGPKPGVQLRVEPLAYDADLGYVPSPPSISTTTNTTGQTVVTIWDGVIYQVTGSLQGYATTTVLTDLYGVETVDIVMNPLLYKVSFYIVDADTQAYGTPLTLTGASLSVYYQDTGRTVNLTLDGPGDYYYLPAGTYTFTAFVPHYIPQTVTVDVSGETSVSIPLNPETYHLTLKVYQNDPTPLNIGDGPLGGAVINVTMVWPVPGMVSQVVYTDPSGVVSLDLRYGIYRIDISHTYTEGTSLSITLANDTVRTVTLDLNISSVTFYFKDSQFTLYGITNVTLTLSYQGSSWQNNVTINTTNRSIITLNIPYGQYIITAKAKYYETYIEATEVKEPSIFKYVYMDPAMAEVRVQVSYSPLSGNLTQGPIQGALVTLKLKVPPIPTSNISAVTGSDGIAIFYVRQGVYDIVVQSEYTEKKIDTNVEIVGDTLLSEPVTPGTVQLEAQVVDARSSAIIPGAQLVVVKKAPGVQKSLVYTLENGTANLTLPAGQYEITATYTGRYTPLTLDIDMPSGTSAHATFPLEPLTGSIILEVIGNSTVITIEGTEITLPETPIVGAVVTLIPDDPLLRAVYNRTIILSTDSAGTAVAQDLRVGSYILRVEASGYDTYEVPIQITAQTTLSLRTILMPKLAQVSLHIYDNGLADPEVTNYLLTIASYNNVTVEKTVNITEPLTRIRLPTGVYHLIVSKDRYETLHINLTVVGEEEYNFTYNITPITVTVQIGLNSQGPAGIKGPVSTGILQLQPLDWNLKDVPIQIQVVGGLATGNLRLGNYGAYLYEPSLGIKVPIGQIGVTSDTTIINLTITPPARTVTLQLKDRDLMSDIYGAATITLEYTGPFGTGSVTATTENATLTMEVPAGNYSVSVVSDYYETYQTTLIITSNVTEQLVLAPVRVQVSINLVDIDGNPVTVTNVTITLIHQQTGESMRAFLREGKIVPYRGLRLGDYDVEIVPPEGAPINYTRAVVTVTPQGVTPSTITAQPRIFKLTIILYDPVAGKPATQQFTVSIVRSGKPATEYGLPINTEVTNGTLTVHVPYGVYTISVKGAEGSFFKDPAPQTLLVDRDMNFTITLEPLTFTGTIIVTDDRNQPLPGAIVVVLGPKGPIASGTTDQTGQFVFQSVYGPYTVQVTAKGYKQGIGTLYLPTQSTATIALKPTPITVVKRYSILIVGLIGIMILGAVLYFARGKLMARLAEEEEYF
ncbi:MAG: carboxypeptidase-like regulatory domain-containing protein [Desulfurococcales archaeon]|nr:carboxypeptidase-like regulatory domain-containing protein [Desulfurococcales archaeon]